VVVIDDADDAVPTARALLAGGIGVIELTLRTPAALSAIERVATEVPEIVIGAGTVTAADHAKQAADAGAKFLVTPGCTDAVANAPSYLALANVGCVGGSWLTASLDPVTIEKLAAEAAQL